MIDMGSIDGSISGIDTSTGQAFDSSTGAFGVDVGGTTNSSLDNGASIDLGNAGVAAYNAGQMAFTQADASALTTFGLGTASIIASTAGNPWATAAGVAALWSSIQGPLEQALTDMAHDMNMQLGIGILANPSISQYAANMASVGVTSGVDTDGSITIMYGGGMWSNSIANPANYVPTPMDSGLGG